MIKEFLLRSSSVKAAKLTDDAATFVLEFNAGRTGYPFAMDNGTGVFIVTADGKSTALPIGRWVVEGAHGIDIYDDASFSGNFCPAAS
jgi:hypothetical protein